MTTSFASVFDSVTRQIKALRQTPLEKEVSDATSNDNWGVANSALIQLARSTNDFNNFAVIMKGIWEGLSDKREKWRRIYKSLVLLEYCIKHGSGRVADEARSELFRIRPLSDFKFMEEGREKGPGIREKSKLICDLLADNELLKAERLKAMETKEKYGGIASNGGGGQTIITPGGYTASSSSASAGPARPMESMGNEEHSTSKLDEYKERERARKSQNASANRSPAEPVISSSGKMVVKPPPVTGRSKPVVARQSSSSSSGASSPEKISSNLIDFDAPAVPVQQARPPVVAQTASTSGRSSFSASPVIQQSAPATSSFSAAFPAPIANPAVQGYPQPAAPNTFMGGFPPTSASPGYPQAMPGSFAAAVANPAYNMQPAMGFGQPLQGGYPQYGQPAYPSYGQPQQGPYGQPSQPGYPQMQQPGFPGAYGQPAAPMAGTNPYAAPVKDSNPFAAFNGL